MPDWDLVNGMGDEHDFDESLFARGHDAAETPIGLVGVTSQSQAEQLAMHHLHRGLEPESHRRAAYRGWSTKVGSSATATVPRGGSPWTDAEDRDLRAAAAKSNDLGQIAKAHGRTETAIACRLEHLGYDRDALIAMDFADVELRVVSHMIANNTNGADKMKMTANRLMLLLAAYRGSLDSEPRTRTTAPDLCFLTVEGLLSQDGFGGHFITDEGRATVEGVLGKTSTSNSRSGASTSWAGGRNTSVLDDQRFFLVASGDCMKGGPHGRPQLKKPPTTVQSSPADAEREAKRLAGISRGEKFFVLQATSVHEVAPAPATSRRL